MSIQAVLLPLFVQAVVTLVVLYVLAARRFAAVRGGKLRGPVGLREPNWPDDTRQAEYNYQNQFELPVLFYVLTILVIMTKQADLLFVLLAWIFVVTRALHAFVHLTSNSINYRASFFVVGAVVLTIMWIVFIVRFLIAAG
jgi:hypothetical protein